MTILLATGSPRGTSSTSHAINSYLGFQLRKTEAHTEECLIHKLMKNDEGIQTWLDQVARCSTLILTFPLYHYSLPAMTTKALEQLIKSRIPLKDKRMAAIVNCGFPEHRHNDDALRVCQAFCSRVHMQWAGSLSMGEGPLINGNALTNVGFPVRRLRAAIDIAAQALAHDLAIPPEASRLTEKLFISKRLYLFAGGYSWKHMAKQHENVDIYARPFDAAPAD
ncbi:MAG: hypothetical protein EOL87_13570 [Spartobacteria bacterium]|nr:hypothetical protein [Spartobacteria bacterium]